jgi:uncharacterized protein (TIGR03435 family)
MISSVGLFAQSSNPPAFEVATIKAATPVSGGGRTSTSGNTVIYNNTTLLNALVRAFGVTSANQIIGPAWVREDRYDIMAKASENTPKGQIPLMLQTLLVDRFKLMLHHETRDLPAYDLVIGNGKLKLVENGNDQKNSAVVREDRRELKSTNMAALAQLITLTLRTPVIDKTGLSGFYDFPYEISQEEAGRDSAPSIFTIIADLGLKLASRKAPLDVIVIDAGNRIPDPN